MARIRVQKTSFTSGEISPRLLGRGDLKAYDNGAARLRNVFVQPTGGLGRRSGLRYVDTARGRGRLVPFEFNSEQVYLLVFTDRHLAVYSDGVKVADLTTPWTESQVAQINWTQTADTLLVVHPAVPPKKVTRDAGGSWNLADWSFVEKDGRIFQPHHKFADTEVTLTSSIGSGSATLTASAGVFVDGHVGTRMRLADKEVAITAVTSPTEASAEVKEEMSDLGPTKDWEEQALSAARGWPASVCFHQDRMVIGGSRDLPNRLWLSKSSDLFNFDLGEGLDDESIEFAILSDQVNAIRAVFSGRHLQVFTSGAEWMVTGDPLTPEKVQLHRQTRIGSPVDRTVPPRDVDGATLFVPRNGPELREFLFADVEQAYQANDLAMLARHLIDGPVDQDYDNGARLFHLVMRDGTIGTVTIFRTEQVTAWTRQQTDGSFLSVAVAGDRTYVLVDRAGAVLIEVFDDRLMVDSGLNGTATEPQTAWSGLDHLEGRTVCVLADRAVRARAVVENGMVTLDEPASEVQVGLPYTHIVEPLPPALSQGGGNQGGKVRPVAVTLRLEETASLRIDVGRGFVEVPFKRFGDAVLDAPPPRFTGDRKLRSFGWKDGGTEPMWRIEDNTPLPFNLLSVTTEISANG